MTTKLLSGRDAQGYVMYAPFASDTNYSATLAANSAQSITVPSDADLYIVIFAYQPGINVWVSDGHTAAAPAGATFAATNSMQNPAQLTVKAGAALSLLTDTTGGGDVGVRIYAVS